MLTIVFLAAILTVFLLFGLWRRLQLLQEKTEQVEELLLFLLRDDLMAKSAEPTVRKPVIQRNGAVRFEST